jgi:hypothetical protein
MAAVVRPSIAFNNAAARGESFPINTRDDIGDASAQQFVGQMFIFMARLP